MAGLCPALQGLCCRDGHCLASKEAKQCPSLLYMRTSCRCSISGEFSQCIMQNSQLEAKLILHGKSNVLVTCVTVQSAFSSL